MGLTQKYNLSTSPRNAHLRGHHCRLERPVEVVRVAKQNPERDAAVRQVASNIARLDHPSIPHLIDFSEDKSTMYIVLESISHEGHDSSPSLLDAMSQVEQIVDALAHASRFDIAHGELQRSCMVIDPQGIPKLPHLGIHQAMAPEHDLDTLRSRDLTAVKSIIAQTLASPVKPELDESNQTDRLEFADQLQQLIEPSSSLSITDFHHRFRQWLHHERQHEEARQLSFDTLATAEYCPAEAALARRTRGVAIVVAGCGAILLMAITAYFWQPGQPTELNQQNLSSDSRSMHEASAPTARLSNLNEARSTSSATPISSLGNVGVLNNPNSKESASAESAAASSSEASMTMHVDSVTSANESSTDIGFDATHITDNRDQTSEDDTGVVALPSANPFEETVETVDLPEVTNTDFVSLAKLQPAAEQEIRITLLGGTGAHTQTIFELSQGETAHHWKVTVTSPNSADIVAHLKIDAEELQFQWTDAASRTRGAEHLCNAILQLSANDNSHDVNLRKPQILSTWKPELDRRRTLDLEIHNSPSLDDLYLEVIPSTASRITASPARISFKDDWMMIGLDAAEDSRFGVRLEPIRRGSPRLRVSAWGRQTPDVNWRPLKGDYGQQLANSIAQLRRNMMAAKIAEEHLEEKRDRSIAKLRIRKIEELIEQQISFRESLLLATEARLAFRVYRQVQDREIEIARFENDNLPSP